MGTVFISYSHDSEEHSERVLALANRLSEEGVDCVLDQYVTSPAEGWPKWMDRQLKKAEYVIIICTETYLNRVMGEETPGKGKGIKWESTLTYQYIYDSDSQNTRFIPVVFDPGDCQYIPTPLKGATTYCVNTQEGYDDLYRQLTDQPRVVKPIPGAMRKLPPEKVGEDFPFTAAAPAKGKPRLGPLVHKMCNRILQVNEFMRFFLEQSKKCPKRPQFYFIHGDEWQGHESLLERLMKTCLKDFAEKKWGQDYATISLDEVPWPKEGKLEDREEHLKMDVMERFAGYGDILDFSAHSLARLPCFDKRPLVLIKHNIYSSKWDNLTLPLLSWYMQDYWSDLEGDEEELATLFLVFFNISYRSPEGPGFIRKILNWKAFNKEDIREQLEKFSTSAPGHCPCLLLRELTPIEREDVMDWFSENNIFEFDADRKKRIDAIFRENDRQVKTISWAKAEIELIRIVKEYGYQREEQLI